MLWPTDREHFKRIEAIIFGMQDYIIDKLNIGQDYKSDLCNFYLFTSLSLMSAVQLGGGLSSGSTFLFP